MSDLPRAIAIDGFTVERPRYFTLTRPPRKPRRHRPALTAIYRRYETSIGGYSALRPRFESRVEHRVDATVDEVLRALALRFEHDDVAHEFKAAARMRIRW